MRYLIIIAAIITTLAACKTKTNINYGLLGCYKLDEGETEAKVSKADLKIYDDELRVAQLQTFINKFTQTKTGKRYFSHIMADLPDTIITKLKADTTFMIVEEKQKDTLETSYHFYKIKKSNGMLINKVIFKPAKLSNSVMVDAVSGTQEHWNDFYNNSSLFIEKLNCENENEKK